MLIIQAEPNISGPTTVFITQQTTEKIQRSLQINVKEFTTWDEISVLSLLFHFLQSSNRFDS